VVFVVDDDQSVRDALSNLIRSIGLQAQTFDSGRDFLSYERPDAAACLVLDVRLPGLSGLDLQRELAAAGEQIPIIFITGHGDIPMTVRAMKAGAAEFLPKPFREQDLLDAIQQALAKDRQAREQRAELSTIRDRYETLTGREREVMTLTCGACSTSRSPPSSASARSPSRSIAAVSCRRWRRARSRSWYAWRQSSRQDNTRFSCPIRSAQIKRQLVHLPVSSTICSMPVA
jgi:FixJ family two-component response regulator